MYKREQSLLDNRLFLFQVRSHDGRNVLIR